MAGDRARPVLANDARALIAVPPSSPWTIIAGRAAMALPTLAAVTAALLAFGLVTGWWRVLPVLSPSMRPELDAGSAVLAVRAPTSSVQPGDVLVYHAPVADRRLVIHRVVKLVEAGSRPVVQTKGDANSAPDPWVAGLQGEWVWKVRGHLPHVGHALVLLHRPQVRVATLLLIIGSALVVALRAIWRSTRPQPNPSRGS
jgi:signal peptidase I